MARPKNIEYGQSYRFQLAHRGQSRPIEHNRNFTRRDRSSEENALSLLTTTCEEDRKVLGGREAFSSYSDSKVTRKPDYCAHNDGTIVVLAKVFDKPAIDLNLIKLEIKKLHKRRMAGTKIIQSKFYAHLA